VASGEGLPVEKQLCFREDKLEKRLLPLLVGKVFHVTSWRSYCSIKSDGFIDTYPDGRFYYCERDKLPFGVRNGYVCLFDLRGDLTAIGQESGMSILSWMSFLQPHRPDGHKHAYFIVDSAVFDRLIPNSAARDEDGCFTRGKAIPYIECWYPGRLSLDSVGEVYEVTVTASPRPQMSGSVASLAELLMQMSWDKTWRDDGS